MQQYWVHDGVAKGRFPNFMKNPASLPLSARLLLQKSKSSELRDETLSLYKKVINFFFATHAVKYQESYKRDPEVAPREFAKRLYTKAFCVALYAENFESNCGLSKN